ncbi:SusC/RagA family TonB-linked outer membrane protein [Mariniflexile sp. HNIBRBA6329]
MKLKLIILTAVLTSWSAVFAQKTISGSIQDLAGMPLPGASIIEKGTTNGVQSDFDGNFVIDINNENATLIISYIGYLSKEVSVIGKDKFLIQLGEDTTALDEVVVVGYGTTIKKNITTSVVSVDATDIPNSSNSGVTDLLFGKAAGVQVNQSSSQPGGRVNLSIRGRGNPLVVVDGVIVPSSNLESGVNHAETNNVNRGNLGGVNPNDIQSVEILKDASAAIYGVNAANGVILITTKKGKSGAMKVNVNLSHSLQVNAPYLEQLEAKDYMQFYNRFEEDRYLAQNNMQPFGNTAPSGYVPTFSNSDINNTVNTDWLDQLLKSGYINNLNMNASGGSEKATYYFSGGYFDQEGTVQNSGLKQLTGKLSLSFQILPFAKLNVSANGNRSTYGNPVAGQQTGGGGANSYGALQAALAYPRYLPVKDPNTGEFTQFGLIGNPVAQLDIKDESKNSSLLTTTSLDLTIIPEMLTGKVLYGYNEESSFRDFFIPSTTNWFDDNRARASLQQSDRERHTFESYLTFVKDFTNLKINAVAGFGEYIDKGFGFGVQAFDMLDNINTTNISGAPTNGNSWKYINKTRSYFARASFDLFDRYLIEGAIRHDGFSQFFPESKFASFPSISVGWKISNEPFFESLKDNIDLLKLRGSYGTTGETLPSGAAYGYYNPIGDVIAFEDGSVSYVSYRLSQLDDPSLTWQKTIMKNIGLDIEMFKGRLYGSFEWFQDNITNLLRGSVNTSALSAISTRPANGGEQVREGFDINIGGDLIRTNDVRWDMAVNLSHFDYKWVERFAQDDPSTFLNVNDPVRSMYAFETNGIIQIGEAISDYQPATASIAGAPRFVDQNGDNVLDRNDVIIYDQTPNLSFGLTTKFTYKNFDISTALYGQVGSFKQNYSLNWANPISMLDLNTSGSGNTIDVWSSQNPKGTLPGVTYDETALGNIGDTVNWGSDITISNADFLRVRSINLGYTITSEQLKSVFFNDMRVYVDIQNPFLFTSYEGGDPEVFTPSVKGASAPYPIVKSFALGLNINF